MNKVGKYRSNIIDHQNGENVNYEEVTTYFDGSLMDDSKCDGVIYRKDSQGTYLKRVLENSTVNVEWFGAVADDTGDGLGTDNSQAFQDAIDIVYAIGGGVVFIPSSYPGTFFRIQKVYVLSGVVIKGAGSLYQNNIGDPNYYRGSKVVVGSGGLGFVVGHPTNKDRGCESSLLDFSIKGTNGAISGVRLGSDNNYSPANNTSLNRVQIRGFTNSGGTHPIIDKSTVDLGSQKSAFTVAEPFTGAAAIFISTCTYITIRDCHIVDNRNGIVESSPRNSYLVWMFGGRIAAISNYGLVLHQMSFLKFFGVDMESISNSAIKADIPIRTDRGRNGVSDLLFSGCHFEISGSDFLYIRNQNDDYYCHNIVVDNPSGGINPVNYAHLEGVSGVIIKTPTILSSGLFYTTSIGRNPVRFTGDVSNISFDVVEERTIIDNTNVGIGTMDVVKNTGGGLNYYFPNASTGTNTSLAYPLSYSEIPSNTLRHQTRAKVIIECTGVFAANDNKKTLSFEFNEDELIRNLKYTNPNGLTWKILVTILRESTTEHTIKSEMYIGAQKEDVSEVKRTESISYWDTAKYYRVYGRVDIGVSGEITCNSQKSQIIYY